MKNLVTPFLFIALLLCACRPNAPKGRITAETAYEGVNNYCHSTYDWSSAQTDSVTMYVTMGEETDSVYQVLFRSYTGALVYFYVNKESGSTKIVEHVPALGVTNEAGAIDLFDYIGNAGDKTKE